MVATLLPNGRQQFVNANGVPLVGGFVYTYVPGTSTPKTTWQDAGETTPNANPIVLDSLGSALIYGSGNYRQVVQDSSGNTIWDTLSSQNAAAVDVQNSAYSWGGTSTGAANTYSVTLSPAITAYTTGQRISFLSHQANTGAATFNAGPGSVAITKRGSTALNSGDIPANATVELQYDGTNFELMAPAPLSSVGGSGNAGNLTVINATGTAIVDGLVSLNAIGVQNYIIDGGVEVSQPGGSATLGTSFAWQALGPDMYAAWATGTTVSAGTVTQDTSAPLGRTGRALKVAGATITGTGIVYMRTRIESKDAVKLQSAQASLSVMVQHDVGSNITVTPYIRKANATDNFSATTQIAAGAGTVVPSGSATQVTLTNIGMGACGNGIEIEIQFACGAVTTKDFWATEWQLIEGASVPATYPRQTWEDILRSVTRYRQRSYDYGSANATATHASIVGNGTTNAAAGIQNIGFPVEFQNTMRVAPSLATWDGGGNSGKFSAYVSGAWTDNAGSITTPQIGTNGFIGYTSSSVASCLFHFDADSRLT